MKIAIYAISKNEEKNVDRFMDSVGDIPVYVLDHSTDGTAEKLRARGAIVYTTPIDNFTFEKGKNFALKLVPDGVRWCLNIDLDEQLNMSREHLEFCLEERKGDEPTIIRHLYKPDHEIDRLRHECRLHVRYGYQWELPIHERLVWTETDRKEKYGAIDELLLTQYPSRNRKHTWSARLIDAVKKYPQEKRLQMFCGRDLFFDGDYEQALGHFLAFLDLNRHKQDQYDAAYVHRMIAKCYNKIDRQEKSIEHFRISADCAKVRESYVDLAHAYMQRGQYGECLEWARKALKITEGEYAPHSDPGAWSFKPHELIGIALYNLGGKIKDALRHSDLARTKAVTDEDVKRISENITVMRSFLR